MTGARVQVNIGAKVGSEFGSAFRSADRQISELSQKMQGFRSSISKMDAFQKLKRSSVSSAQSLRSYKSELRNLQSELAKKEKVTTKDRASLGRLE